MRALLELEGRLAEALPVRPLVPAEGLLLEGRLLTVGLLVLVRPALTLPVALPVVGRTVDMLPPLVGLLPSSCRLWLIEPAVPVL